MVTHLKIRRNITLFKIHYFCLMCWPLSALSVVYFNSITHSYTLALGIFAIVKISQSLTEIPTGVISDRIGRRVSMIAGALFFFLLKFCFALAGNYQSSLLLIFGALCWGIGDSFMSGTDEALIYDTMAQLRKQHKYDIVFSKSKIFHQLGGALSSVIAICVLYFYSLHVLAWVSILPSFVQLVASFLLVEPSINSTKDANSIIHLKHAWNNIKTNPKLKKASLLICANKAVNMTTYRMESIYFSQLIANWLVSIVILLRQLCGAVSFSIVPFVRKFGFLRIIIVSVFGNAFIRTIGLIFNNALSPFIMFFQNLFRGTTETAESALLQQEFSSAQRATMGSLVALLGGFIMALSYYVFGLIADAYSVYTAVWVLIIAKVCIGWGYTAFAKQQKKE